ncbi:hypothetical protein CRG98_038451 [Punica granatum]|uniref:Plastid lipid-associated protein/fibrillin conserved domain-containing protein n=1 Tax=Punica granatum TaxID=22663 RepID=A0A2I0ICN7_PUNGR|nr:hypothetical protein CRG98_038451 [Punica granatum]
MELAFASRLCFPAPKQYGREVNRCPSNGYAPRRYYSRKKSPYTVACTAQQAQLSEVALETQKHELLRAVQDTQRGLVSLEGYCSGAPIDLVKLDGTWRLQYTSAPDVLVLFESAARLPFFQVGQIFQRFDCRKKSDGGSVDNVVQWSVPSLLEEENGATLLVSAKFSVVSARNIYLQFEEINLQNFKISAQLQALITPAILPRSFLSLQVLQFIRAFKAQIPVQNPGRQGVGGLYYLSYLDRDMLLGRAVGGGGVFVFTRAQPLDF